MKQTKLTHPLQQSTQQANYIKKTTMPTSAAVMPATASSLENKNKNNNKNNMNEKVKKCISKYCGAKNNTTVSLIPHLIAFFLFIFRIMLVTDMGTVNDGLHAVDSAFSRSTNAFDDIKNQNDFWNFMIDNLATVSTFFLFP